MAPPRAALARRTSTAYPVDLRKLSPVALDLTTSLDYEPDTAFSRLARMAIRLLDACAATITFVEDDVLFCIHQTGMPDAWTERRTFPLDRTVCRLTLEKGGILTIADVHDDPRIDSEMRDDLEDLRAYAGVPFHLSGGSPTGTFAVWSRRARGWSDDEIQLLDDLAATARSEIRLRKELAAARHAKSALDFRNARADAGDGPSSQQRIEANLRFLAGAGRVLVSSLDTEETLRHLARLAVPDVADFCLIDILDEDGRLRRVETSHVDPQKEAIGREIVRRFPPDLDSANTSAVAVREGRSTLMRELPESHLESIASDDDHLALLHALDAHSVMTVPLAARGRALGAISFVMSETPRHFDPEDLALAEDLARLAGLAIDNARLYEEALQASRAKSNFLAIVSHELRTPLTTVIGYSDLLLNGIPEPISDPVQRYVDRIRTSAWYQAALIEQILSFSRLEGEREELVIERIEIGRFLESHTGLIAARAAERNLDFQIHTPQDPVWIETDPSKLRQILLNLLSNALKFTHEGHIRLTFEDRDDETVFHVEDSGIGIAPEHLGQIFEPFWQAEDATTRSTGGAGLGLAVARRLARQLQGDLVVTSEPEHGTTVTVRLPREVHVVATWD